MSATVFFNGSAAAPTSPAAGHATLIKSITGQTAAAPATMSVFICGQRAGIQHRPGALTNPIPHRRDVRPARRHGLQHICRGVVDPVMAAIRRRPFNRVHLCEGGACPSRECWAMTERSFYPCRVSRYSTLGGTTPLIPAVDQACSVSAFTPG